MSIMMANIAKINLNEIIALVLTSNIYSWHNDIPCFWEHLSKVEKEKGMKFINNDLRDKYIICHGLLRSILSIYTKIHPNNICYKFNPFNKPYLANDSSIEFNMSHSKDYVAYIISLENQVGIDIEWRDPDINIEKLQDIVLNQLEINYFRNINSKDKLEEFYNIWVKKEAIIKAIGQGCNYDIKNIDFISSDSRSYPYHLYKGNKFYYSILGNIQEYAMAISILDSRTNMIPYYEL